MPSPSLAQLGEISKAGGPFDLTAYQQRRAQRKARQIKRRGAISDAVGHRVGRIASAAVQDAGEQARHQVHEGLLDSTAVGRGWANAVMSDADKRAMVTSNKVANNVVHHGGRLARRAAGWGALGLAGGLGGAAAISEGAKAARRSWERRQDRKWQPVTVGKSTQKERNQRRMLTGIGAGAALGGGLSVARGAQIYGRNDKIIDTAFRNLNNEPPQKLSRVQWARRGIKNTPYSGRVLTGRGLSGAAIGGALGLGGAVAATRHLENRYRRSRGLKELSRQPRREQLVKADWKNITQRELEARNARRAKRHGRSMVGYGILGTGAGVLGGGIAGGAVVGQGIQAGLQNAKQDLALWESLKEMDLAGKKPSRVGWAAHGGSTAFKMLPARYKAATALTGGGLAAILAGNGMRMYGTGRERNAERKIAEMRRRRAIGKAADLSPSEFADMQEYRRALAEQQLELAEDQRKAGRATANLGAGAAAVGVLGSRSLRRNVGYNYRSMKQMQRGIDELTGRGGNALARGVRRPVIAGRAGVGTARAFRSLPFGNRLSAGLMAGGAGTLALGSWAQSAGRRNEKMARERLARIAREQ